MNVMTFGFLVGGFMTWITSLIDIKRVRFAKIKLIDIARLHWENIKDYL